MFPGRQVDVVGAEPRRLGGKAKARLAFAQFLILTMLSERKAHQPRSRFKQPEISRRRSARFAVVHRDCPKHDTGVIDDRHRPAGAQSAGKGELAWQLPKRVGRDIAHDDGLFAKGRGTARTDGRTDLEVVDDLIVAVRQAWPRTETEMAPIGLQEQDRAERRGSKSFDKQRDVTERLGKRRASGHNVDNVALCLEERRKRKASCRGLGTFRNVGCY